MKPNFTSSNMPASRFLYASLLLTGTIARILLSPKWVFPIAAWFMPVCLLFYFRHATIKFKVLWFFVAMLFSQMISSYGVAPFPLPVLAIVSIIDTLKTFAVFIIDRWISKRTTRFISTLIFPATFVAKEFWDISYNGGAWWSIANTQYSFSWLTQLSSVTGLVGISFIIYWFASVVVWSAERSFAKERFIKSALLYASVFAAVILFGALRYYSNDSDQKQTVKIAGVTVPSISVSENIYKDVTHQNISVDLKTSIISKELQQVNSALIPFLENPDSAKFVNGYKAMHELHDSLFALSQKAANKGAKIIVWSEANAIMPDFMQKNFIKRGEDFAAKNKVYLLMAMAVFQPGKITAERNFLENKTVLVSPEGKILNVFHKNHPVPFAEHSAPGNGKIPVIPTPYGNLSVSICYDADLAVSMEQLGKIKSDILFLPSGDWYDIAPFHSYMAIFRGIENGTTVVRQASGGLSLATDYRGKTQTSFDFYQSGEKLWISDIATGHVNTIYCAIGDVFAYACILITAIAWAYLVIQFIAERNKQKAERKIFQPAI